ncbi:MAG: TIGR04255 family protein [Bacteroidales bacterium]|nr:TIGR04255 family protein [Bacteroidales bacterium]
MKELKDIPKKITPDPILEAIVDIRFTTLVPSEAVFGLLYNRLSTLFPRYEKLPILQLPEAVRNSDKSLEFAPHYKFINNGYEMQIGPKVIAIIRTKPYIGWDNYYEIITNILTILSELKFIDNITRVGVRYIDFFTNSNIFSKLKFKVENFPFNQDQTTYVTTFLNDSFRTNLQVSNATEIIVRNEKHIGSIFDTDTYKEEINTFNLNNLLQTIRDAHDLEKRIFYTLIDEEFIENFNPEYE